MFSRWTTSSWARKLTSPYVQVIFGARQTGKSTLLRQLAPESALWLDFSHPAQRATYLSRPEMLIEKCRQMPRQAPPPIAVVDEAQNVPPIFDSVQHLYDGEKERWRFVLCGSSARKLRVTGANLLPGRCFLSHLYPLVTAERPFPETGSVRCQVDSPLPLVWPRETAPGQTVSGGQSGLAAGVWGAAGGGGGARR